MIVERRHIRGRERPVEKRRTPRFDIRSIREEVQIASYFVKQLSGGRQRRPSGRHLSPLLIVRNER